MSKIAATIAAGLAAATFAIAIPATAEAAPNAGISSVSNTRTTGTTSAPDRSRSTARSDGPAPAAAISKIGSLNAKLAGLGINLPK